MINLNSTAGSTSSNQAARNKDKTGPSVNVVDSSNVEIPAKQKSRSRLPVISEEHQIPIPSAVHLKPGGDQRDSSVSLIPERLSSLGEDALLLRHLADLPPPESIYLSFWKKVLISSGHVLNDLCASLWFTYALLYFDKVVGFGDPNDHSKKTNHAAIVVLVGQLVDAIVTPLIGYAADQPIKCWLCNHNYGRCKSWHLLGSFLTTTSFPFIFSACIGCSIHSANWAKLAYYIPFVIVFQIGWAAVQVSHLALVPKVHPDDLVRTDILAKRYGFTVFSNILVFLLTWFTLGNGEKCRITPADSTKFMRIGLITTGIGALITILFHVGVKEKPDTFIKKNVAVITSRTRLIRRLSHCAEVRPVTLEVLVPPPTLSKNEIGCEDECNKALSESGILEGERNAKNIKEVRSIQDKKDFVFTLGSRASYFSTKALSLGRDKMTLKDWFKLPQFYIVAVIYMATRLSVNMGQVFMSYFVQYSLWLPCNTVATVPLTMFLAGFVVSLGIKFLNKHLGRQVSYALCASVITSGALMVLFLPWDGHYHHVFKTYIIYVVAALIGGGSSGILITSLSITADMIGNNVENSAFVYGCMSFCDKLSCGLTILLIDSLKPCEYSDDNSRIPPTANLACKNQVTKYYRNVLGYSTGGCAVVGILACIVLSYRIHYQRSRKTTEQDVLDTQTRIITENLKINAQLQPNTSNQS